MSLILFEHKNFVVVNKPAGVLSQGDKSGDEDICALLKRSYAQQFPKSSFLAPAHRLDRNTSGAMLLAKSSSAATELSAAIKHKDIQRTYLAVVKGNPGAKGTFDFPLEKDSRTNEVKVSSSGQAAVTEYVRLMPLGSASLMRVTLITGRSHQIRAHFAHAGHALLGDKKYAAKPWSEIFQRPALHSHIITMPEKMGAQKYVAPIPDDLQRLIEKLGGDPSAI